VGGCSSVLSTSASLLERARNGADGTSWQRLVELYTPLLRSWLQRNGVPDADAEDLLQEVFAVLVRKLPDFDYDPARGSFRSWLRTILAHVCQAFWRNRYKHPAAAGGSDALRQFQELADPGSQLSRLWDREHDLRVAERLLQLVQGDFAETTWQAFRRVVIDGVGASEAAQELGLSVNAVLIAKSRVLRRLEEEGRGLIH
jgi:RNA polymerase sigma factor (sigma-70 family)